MLIEPASKVSVPLDVVMRTLSSVPERVIFPAPQVTRELADITPLLTQILLLILVKITCPHFKSAARLVAAMKIDVELLAPAPTLEVTRYERVVKYPVVATVPDPTCTITSATPFTLTPLNITVILLTQDGIPVKSIDVPEVDATAVPEVNVPTPLGVPEITGEVKVCPVAVVITVPLTAGKVKTVLPATAGAWSVTEPLVSPETTIDDIMLSPAFLD